MIARVSLEIALRKEFDYVIPPELVDRVDVGSRVQVPFGPRKVLGVVTAVAEESAHAKLKPILKVIGAQTLVTPKVLKLARWIADYYCCAPEIALKSVLPEVVRREQAGDAVGRAHVVRTKLGDDLVRHVNVGVRLDASQHAVGRSEPDYLKVFGVELRSEFRCGLLGSHPDHTPSGCARGSPG
jgi:primosomal protein N'